MKKRLFNSAVFVATKLWCTVKFIWFPIKIIGKILLHKNTHTILGSLNYIAALIVAGTAMLGYFYTIKPTFDKKMLENKITTLSQKEQSLVIENQRISEELLKKENELPRESARIIQAGSLEKAGYTKGVFESSSRNLC